MEVYNEAYIERWAEIYLANPHILRGRGILFETFLLMPVEILDAAAGAGASGLPADLGGFRPLLPAQQRVQERLFDEELEAFARELGLERSIAPTGPQPLRRRNGCHLVEPLAHHRRADRVLAFRYRGRG